MAANSYSVAALNPLVFKLKLNICWDPSIDFIIELVAAVVWVCHSIKKPV